MPYKSKAQERWAHTPAGKKALGGAANVKEWDRETKGKELPERAPSRSTAAKGPRKIERHAICGTGAKHRIMKALFLLSILCCCACANAGNDPAINQDTKPDAGTTHADSAGVDTNVHAPREQSTSMDNK